MTAKHSLPNTTASNVTENGGSGTSKETTPTTAREENASEHRLHEKSNEQRLESASVERTPPVTGSEDGDVDTARPQRPMSPGTLALMCDEKDPLFTAPPSPTGGPTQEDISSTTSHAAQLHAEQERAILLEYRDCLRRIISVGKRRGALSIHFLLF